MTGSLRTLRLVVVGLLIATAWTLGAGLLGARLLGYERFVIAGRSMTGSYDRGSLVLARPTTVAHLRAGDVITFFPPPEWGVKGVVTHRIQRIAAPSAGTRELRTRGDANRSADPWRVSMPVDAQVARAKVRIPHLGWVFAALGVRWVRVLVIGFPALVIAARAATGLRRPGPLPA